MPRSSRVKSTGGHDVNRALSYHASAIMALWVLLLGLSIGVGLVLLVSVLRLDDAEKRLFVMSQDIAVLQDKVDDVTLKLQILQMPLAALPPTSGQPASSSVSPSGALDRGSFSPDGTKYAGYNDAVKSKVGVAVEIVETQKVKYIELFNPLTESTGKGTEFETQMSVRWLDAQTIEYDILVKKGSAWVKEIRTTKIFF